MAAAEDRRQVPDGEAHRSHARRTSGRLPSTGIEVEVSLDAEWHSRPDGARPVSVSEPTWRLHSVNDSRFRVLIAGGGVAGLEGLLALRHLVGVRARIEVLAPEREFTYRQLAVAEPFSAGEVARFDLTS